MEDIDIARYWRIKAVDLKKFQMYADNELSKYTPPKEFVKYWVDYDQDTHTAVCNLDVEVLNYPCVSGEDLCELFSWC